MTGILYALVFFGALGGVLGFALAYFDKKLSVSEDERIGEIAELLPGANCGGCGFAGCSDLARAIVAGTAKADACAGCKIGYRRKIAEIMGETDSGSVTRYRAQVMCSGTGEYAKKKYIYQGISGCVAASKLGGGPKLCPDGCIGLGSCVKSCKFDALSIVKGVAYVNPDKCVGCGTCAVVCPKGLIKLVPYDAPVWVGCLSKEKGAAVRQFCDVGCIGCGICERVCPAEAIVKNGSLAAVDYTKCVGCGACAAKCPRKIIWSRDSLRKNGPIIPFDALYGKE